MAARRTRRKARFLDRYRLDDRILQKADRRFGRPTMLSGVDIRTGERVVIKEWGRNPKIADEDLREIWRQELRQLHRLAGYPGAREHVVLLHDSAEDQNGFYLVLSPGQRVPLQTLMDPHHRQSWLHNTRQDRSRLHLWHNLRRVVVGLEILHTQGLLHRNIDTWAIFTDGGDESDFQLSGFEWSIRLPSTTDRLPSHISRGVGNEQVVHSFLQDWYALGILIASLLQVDVKAFLANRQDRSGRNPAEYLTAQERNLLLSLLRPNHHDRLDGELINQRIDTITSLLHSIVAHREAKLYMTCALGVSTYLSQAIRTASNRTIDVSDVDRQIEFLQDDISEDPLLVAESSDSPDSVQRYVLVGRTLIYRLTSFRPRNQTDGTWAVAFCDRVERQRPIPNAIIGQCDLTDIPIVVLPLVEANRRQATLRSRAARWDRQIDTSSATSGIDDHSEQQHRALVLVQILEALFVAAEIWPISVIDTRQTEGNVVIAIRPRPDSVREELSEALGISPPGVRMRDAFAEERLAAEKEWKITEVGTLGERDRETARWRFFEMESEEGTEPTYVFEGTGTRPLGDTLFLRQGDFVGQERLLRRRIKALRSLREHTELLAMLADPRIDLRPTHDELHEDEEFQALDVSKKEAFRELWSVLPVYLIQGPPGVGKTRLVRDLVSRCFREEDTTRMLLTAQSHQSVDHLLAEIEKVFRQTGARKPLIVRCRPRSHDASRGPYDVRDQALKVVDALSESSLAASAPAEMRTKLVALKSSFEENNGNEEEQQSHGHGKADRAFEALLLRSANMVFSSTNAGDLERLIEERSQFDWTIVEEAGRATGVELVSPLLLSHRRLMIGDHKQLPPFGADQLGALLARPEKVRIALEVGRAMVAKPFREAGMDDVVDEVRNDATLESVCGNATLALLKFESIVDAELPDVGSARDRVRIVKQLSHQHRMHPAIARLVSEAFYEGRLVTDDACERRFREEPSPVCSTNVDRLPESPIVFVNMPYVQSTIGRHAIERRPRYHNPEEVDAVVKVLSFLKAREGLESKPTLAVLTPYREQVRRLRDRINEERMGSLVHLADFRGEGGQDIHIGTVDSFQGNEADVVVVSLVRNNHHAGRRALGFLDSRRMNVLVSRAKWRLVLVGSVEFLEKRFQPNLSVSASDPLYFLWKMLSTLRELRTERDENLTPRTEFISSRKMFGERP